MNTNIFGNDDVLPAPRLDDLGFQQILDRARVLIPRYCPEWTDHNLSDPGITMLELFAHLTDTMLYRVNQVPDRIHLKFLEMVGIRLEPPAPASAELTFYLSKAATEPLRIEPGTEVATRRTEVTPATVFSLAQTLKLEPPQPSAILSAPGPALTATEPALSPRVHWLKGRGGAMDARFSPFPEERAPRPGDALLIALDSAISRGLLKLELECDPERGAGLNPDRTPLEWLTLGADGEPDARCDVVEDTTQGLIRDGHIKLHVPETGPGRLLGIDGSWLKCRIIHREGSEYRTSPRIRLMRVEMLGGTMTATHATTVHDELLGRSDGSPGQEYQLLRRPVVEARLPGETLIVEAPDGPAEAWTEVSDFSGSDADDPHFVLDSASGRITLGPAILQPDGRICQLGRVPPRGSTLRFARYRHGGGAEGNVLAGKLCVLKSSLPFISRVENRRDATGGRDGEATPHARLRAARMLRARDRAVTADDYVFLAEQVEGVARACCVGAGEEGGEERQDGAPGLVRVRILPRLEGAMTEGELSQALRGAEFDALRQAVAADLRARSVVGVKVDVDAPQVAELNLAVRIHLADAARGRGAAGDELRRQIEDALRRHLSPFTGGAGGRGWPFGRAVHSAELRGVVERISGVEFAELVVEPVNPQDPAISGRVAQRRIDLLPWALPLAEKVQIAVARG